MLRVLGSMHCSPCCWHVPRMQGFSHGSPSFAAIAILINRQARLALRLMTLMLALFGVVVWIPRLIARPQAHLNWSEFGLTFLITGADWMMADLKSF